MNTEWHPRMQALDAAAAVIRQLGHAWNTWLLYPGEHPQHGESKRFLTAAVRNLRDACTADPTIFVINRSLYLGSAILARESLSHYGLAKALEQAGIESLTFTGATVPDDLERLAATVAGREPMTGQIGGIGVNQVRPVRIDESALRRRMGDLRRAYAATLDVLRQTGTDADGGGELSVENAHEVVSEMTTEVARDPGYGLLLSAVKSHDDYTHYHMVNVCLLAVALGRLVGLEREQVVALGVGGLFHDIGKLEVPSEILNSPGRLSAEEWVLVQQHPVIGAGKLFATRAGLYHPAVAIALEHHVAYDAATGYPPLSDRRPSMPARLVAVADSFDAVTTKRSYREAMTRPEALQVLLAGAGAGFDPRVVRVFVQLLGSYPIGSLVELTSGEVAVVVRQREGDPLRPTVLVVVDRTGTPVEPEERDLTEGTRQGAPAWSIVRRVDPSQYDIDLPRLVLTGEVAESGPATAKGLVHEPAPGEQQPEGYIDTHAHPHTPRAHDELDVPHDPDVAAPYDELPGS